MTDAMTIPYHGIIFIVIIIVIMDSKTCLSTLCSDDIISSPSVNFQPYNFRNHTVKYLFVYKEFDVKIHDSVIRTQYTHNVILTFIRRRPNIDVGTTLKQKTP